MSGGIIFALQHRTSVQCKSPDQVRPPKPCPYFFTREKSLEAILSTLAIVWVTSETKWKTYQTTDSAHTPSTYECRCPPLCRWNLDAKGVQ